MPDQADVEQALANWVAGALYPEGVGGASAVETVCRVYRGLPIAAGLEADLMAGIAPPDGAAGAGEFPGHDAVLE